MRVLKKSSANPTLAVYEQWRGFQFALEIESEKMKRKCRRTKLKL